MTIERIVATGKSYPIYRDALPEDDERIYIVAIANDEIAKLKFTH